MTDRALTMRIMAERYEQLAKTATTVTERERFREYVKLYREMEVHFHQAKQRDEQH